MRMVIPPFPARSIDIYGPVMTLSSYSKMYLHRSADLPSKSPTFTYV